VREWPERVSLHSIGWKVEEVKWLFGIDCGNWKSWRLEQQEKVMDHSAEKERKRLNSLA
jgi:hypothetical protein